MGWAHEGAAISLTARTATWTRAVGLGGGGVESTAACWVDEVPRPTGAVLGPSSGVFESATAVPGPGLTVAALGPSARILEEAAAQQAGEAGGRLLWRSW